MPVLTHKLYEFYLFLHHKIEKFPKRKQHTLGTRLENLSLELLELSALARSKSLKNQLLILNKIDTKLKIITLLVRAAYDTRSLPLTQQIIGQEKLLELGRIVGGWIKTVKTKEPPR